MDRTNIILGPHTVQKQASARAMRRHMTPAEKALWNKLRGSQLDRLHFRRQQVLDGFIADFYCHAVRLVVEVDGLVHEQQREYDEERTQAFARHGVRVIRFPNERVLTDISGVLTEIRCAASRSGTPP